MKDYKKELENVLDTIRAFGEAFSDNEIIQEWIKVNFPNLKRTKLQRLKDAIIKALSKKEAEDVLINEGFQVSEALDLLKEDEESNFKFKKGDWIIRNTEDEAFFVFQVIDTSVDESGFHYYYTIMDVSRGMPKVLCQEYIESKYRLWNIDDAYDGNFLAYPDGSITIFETRLEGEMFKAYALYLPEKDKIEINQTCCILDVTPVTREQRETFLRKLKEKGYKWNGSSIKINDIFYNWYWFLCTENFTHYDATIFIKGSIYRASDLGIYDANGCFWDFNQFQKDGDSFQNHFKPIVDQDELNKNIKEKIVNFVKNLYGEANDDIIKKITNDII